MKLHGTMAMTALVVAMGAGGLALAKEDNVPAPARGEYILVTPTPEFRGAYATPQDALLLADAFRAVDADRATRSAMLTMVADHGDLTVSGMVLDVGQGTRIDTKLKALYGGTQVISWYDVMSGE